MSVSPAARGGDRPAMSLAATAVGVVSLTLLGRAAGVLSQIVTSAVLGASARADVYYFAITIITIVSSLVFSTVPMVFIPHYIQKRHREGQTAADQFASGVLTYLFLILMGLTLVAALLAWPAVNWIGKFSPGTRVLAARVFMVTVPLIVLMGMAQLLMMLFHARRRFAWPALVGPANALVFTAVVVLGWRRLDVFALVLGTLAGAASQSVILLLAIRKDIVLKPSLGARREDLGELLRLVWPLLISQVLALIWVSVTRSIASGLPAGSLSALAYADGLKALFLGTMVLPIATVALPFFSEKIAQTNVRTAWADLERSLLTLWYLTAPVMVGLVVLAEPLVRLMYQRGAFDTRATQATASALIFYSVGLVGEVGNYLVTRYYMAMKDTRTLTWIAVGGTALHCLLAWWFSRFLLADGVALAYSVIMLLSLLSALVVLKARSGFRFSPTFVRGGLKILVSAAIALAAVVGLGSARPYSPDSGYLDSLVILVGSSMILVAAYLGSSLMSGISRDVPFAAKLHPLHLWRALGHRFVS